MVIFHGYFSHNQMVKDVDDFHGLIGNWDFLNGRCKVRANVIV
jgi:hypothetical protein